MKVQHAVRAAVSEAVERSLRLETKGDLPQYERGFEYGLYRPTPWLVLRELFGRLEVAEDDVIADIGSGMGRAVFMAARRPFGRVIGIEQDPDLTAIAERNIDRHRHRLACRDVELLTIDALSWEIPDDLTVLYCYCPFPDHVLRDVLARLVASLDRHPRSVRLIYNASTQQVRRVIAETGRAVRLDPPVPWYLRRAFEDIRMYRLKPAAPSA